MRKGKKSPSYGECGYPHKIRRDNVQLGSLKWIQVGARDLMTSFVREENRNGSNIPHIRRPIRCQFRWNLIPQFLDWFRSLSSKTGYDIRLPKVRLKSFLEVTIEKLKIKLFHRS